MKCGFCGYEFDPADAQSACNGCPLMPGCHLLRCPRCGYEMPPEAGLITLLRKLRERSHGTSPHDARSHDARAQSHHEDMATTKDGVR